MHREISPSERLGHGDTPLSLYLLTALLALLLGADLWPALVNAAGWQSWAPSWPREVYGYRFALIAAPFVKPSSRTAGRPIRDRALAVSLPAPASQC